MNKKIYMTYKNQDFPKDLVFERWTKLNTDYNFRSINFSKNPKLIYFYHEYAI